MKVTLRIGTLELEGMREAQLPALMERVERSLRARYAGPVQSLRVEALPPLRPARGGDPEAVADAIVDALLSGPLSPAQESP